MTNHRYLVSLINELHDKLWYHRYCLMVNRVNIGQTQIEPDILDSANAYAKLVREKWGIENLGPFSDYEWGWLMGKLDSIAWLTMNDLN